MNEIEPIHTIAVESDVKLISSINVKLVLLGCHPVRNNSKSEFTEIAASFARYCEKERLLANRLSPRDQRIQTSHFDYFQECAMAALPTRTFVLDRPGLARTLSPQAERLEIPARLKSARENFSHVQSPAYLQQLHGSLRAEPFASYLNLSPALSA